MARSPAFNADGFCRRSDSPRTSRCPPLFGYDPILGQQTENPVAVYSRKGFFFPKALIGYAQIPNSDNQPTLHQNLEINPPKSLPITWMPPPPISAPSTFPPRPSFPARQKRRHSNPHPQSCPGNDETPGLGASPALINGLTAFHTSEEEIRSLFQGRSMDIWEMAEALANFGCDAVVIMRGAFGQYLYVRGDQSRWSIPAYPFRWWIPPAQAMLSAAVSWQDIAKHTNRCRRRCTGTSRLRLKFRDGRILPPRRHGWPCPVAAGKVAGKGSTDMTFAYNFDLTTFLDRTCQIMQVAAPTFAEGARAQLMQTMMETAGLEDISQDPVHNVYGRLAGGSGRPLVILPTWTPCIPEYAAGDPQTA